MQALAAGGLAEAFHAECGEMLPHSICGFHHVGKIDVRRGIEVEHQSSRHVILVRRAIPGMQFEPTELRDRSKALDMVDLQIRLAVAGNPHQLEQLRRALHAVALEELLTLDAVGRAYDRAWPADKMRHHPLADGLEIMCEIEFCNRLA